MTTGKLMTAIAVATALGFLTIGAIVWTAGDAGAAEWQGCHVGGSAGYASTNTEADLSFGGAGVTIDGLGADGATLTGMVGCDMRIDRIIIGAWGDYTWHDDSEFSVTASLPPFFSGDVATFAMDDEWSIGGRIGYLITADVLAYGLVGYTEASFDDLDVLPSLGGPSFSIDDMDGIVWGGGLEASLGSGFFVRAEGRYADYDATDVDLGIGGLDLELDPDVVTARVGLIWKMGVPGAVVPAK